MLDETAFQQHQVPLLEPKFHPPRLHATLVERKRLLEKLDAVREHKLMLLCAPAGFGKTTLVRQWMENSSVRGQTLPVAWLSLESSDNDPIRFWRYVITACQAFHADVGHAPLAQLSADLPPFAIPSLEMVLTLLLNNIARLACSGLLVLEDYHLITASHIHETVTFFLDHLPAQLHVVILTRSTPPLPLVRWRARGDLYEMHADDLRFSPEEMANFFQQALAFSLSILPAEALRQLETRLEGWAAGLRLLALALQGSVHQQGVEHILATLAGEQRSLQNYPSGHLSETSRASSFVALNFKDYFVTEVLSTQPEPLQDFLLRTSILSRLTGSLCDAVAERHDSDRLLEDIERAGIFLESLDRFALPLPPAAREWYRYHALFAEAMQAEARHRLGVDALHALSLKASRWYEQQGMFAEAVEAAFQAQDTLRAAELIEHILGKVKHFILAPQVFQEFNGYHTLRRWLEQLPETAFRGHPLLSLGYATALLLVFVVEQPSPPQALGTNSKDQLSSSQALFTRIEEALQMAEEGFREVGDMPRLGAVFAFHALIAREQGDLREAITYAEESFAWLPEDDRAWRSLSLNVIGMGKLIDGQLEQAQKIFLELCALCEAFGNRAILRANTALLNIVTYEQGKLRQTAEVFRQMLAESREEGDRDDIAHASLLLAWLSYEWNDLQAAEQQAQESLNLGRQIGNEEFQVQATLVLARIEHARGQTERAQQRCTALLACLPAISPLRSRLCREVQMTQARFSLALGDFSVVESWWTSNSFDPKLPLVQREREELLVARWLRVSGKATEALPSLVRLLDAAQDMGRTRSALEIQAVLVLVQHSCGHVQEARQSLQRLLARAYSEGYLRLFLDEGEIMTTLLRVIISQVRERPLIAYVQAILRAADSAHTKQHGSPAPAYTLLAEPLSSQEQRVLRLLIAGHSNPAIARDLVVSVNTVKAHLKNIYRKLNVNNRLEACEAARHLDFL